MAQEGQAEILGRVQTLHACGEGRIVPFSARIEFWRGPAAVPLAALPVRSSHAARLLRLTELVPRKW